MAGKAVVVDAAITVVEPERAVEACEGDVAEVEELGALVVVVYGIFPKNDKRIQSQ